MLYVPAIIRTTTAGMILCDQYGLYVVAEANVESHGMGYGDKSLAKNGPFTRKHIWNVINAMYNVAYNHPSIIFWSLGNECR